MTKNLSKLQRDILRDCKRPGGATYKELHDKYRGKRNANNVASTTLMLQEKGLVAQGLSWEGCGMPRQSFTSLV